jgi:hypothetical protein
MTPDEAQARIAELESHNLELAQHLRGTWTAQLQERVILSETEARRLRYLLEATQDENQRLRGLVIDLQSEVERRIERCRTLERSVNEGAAASLFDAPTMAAADRVR